MKKPLFTGLCTALITPLRGGEPDLDALKANIELQLGGGASAILVCGTTGERATLSPKERKAVIQAAVEAAGGRMAVLAGAGGNDTAETAREANDISYLGVNAVLVTAPYFNHATQEGLYRHFSAIADASPAPVVIYDVPSRTGVTIQPETYGMLSRHGNIAAVKDANPDLAVFQRARAAVGEELCFYGGSDDTAVPMLACGAQGLISVLSNLCPRAVSSICRLALEGDFAEASRRYLRYTALSRALFRAPNPIPVKAAMAMMGLDTGELRLPLTPAEAALKEELRKALSGVDLI